MRNVSKPFNFSEQTNNSYFEIFYSLLESSPKVFASTAGQEFFLTFGCAKETRFEKQVKKLLVSYKQRDVIDQTKRSVFYCLILKTLMAISEIDEYKALRILATTSVDLRENEDLKAFASSCSTKELAGLVLC